jgi:hypothetical protein
MYGPTLFVDPAAATRPRAFACMWSLGRAAAARPVLRGVTIESTKNVTRSITTKVQGCQMNEL